MSVKNERKKWPIIVGIIAICLVIGMMNDDAKQDETEVTKQESSKTSQEVKQTEETNEEGYQINDIVSVGDIEYVVNGVQVSKSVGDEYIRKDAQNMYYIVDITISNKGNQAVTVSSSYFKLINGDKEYSTDSYGALYVDDSISYTEVNPDATLTGKIIFDIAQETIDAKNLQLQVQTGVFGTEKENIGGKMMKKNRCLMIAFILGILYIAYSYVYWSGAVSSNDSMEAFGAGIAVALVYPHLLCTAIGVIFNGIGWYFHKRGFALTGGILYAVAIGSFPMYFFFVIIQMIISFIGYSQLKKSAETI